MSVGWIEFVICVCRARPPGMKFHLISFFFAGIPTYLHSIASIGRTDCNMSNGSIINIAAGEKGSETHSTDGWMDIRCMVRRCIWKSPRSHRTNEQMSKHRFTSSLISFVRSFVAFTHSHAFHYEFDTKRLNSNFTISMKNARAQSQTIRFSVSVCSSLKGISKNHRSNDFPQTFFRN